MNFFEYFDFNDIKNNDDINNTLNKSRFLGSIKI